METPRSPPPPYQPMNQTTLQVETRWGINNNQNGLHVKIRGRPNQPPDELQIITRRESSYPQNALRVKMRCEPNQPTDELQTKPRWESNCAQNELKVKMHYRPKQPQDGLAMPWQLNTRQDEIRAKIYCGSNQLQDRLRGLHAKTMFTALAYLLGISAERFAKNSKRRIKIGSKLLYYIICCGYLVADIVVHINKGKDGICIEQKIFLKSLLFSASGEITRIAFSIIFDFAFFNYLINCQYQKRYPKTAFENKVSAIINMVGAAIVLSICDLVFPPLRYSYLTAGLCLIHHLCNFIYISKYEYMPRVYLIKKRFTIRVNEHTVYPKQETNECVPKFMETV